MLRICLCLLAGVLAPQLSSFPPGFDLIAVLLVALLVFLPGIRRSDLAYLSTGYLLFCAHTYHVVSDRLEAAFADDSMLVVFRVVEFPEVNGLTTTFVAEANGDDRIPSRIRLSWYEPPVSVRLGDVWRTQLRLRLPRGSRNPGSMDSEAWLFRERIGATGYVVNSVLTELVDSGSVNAIDGFRERFVRRLDQGLDRRESAAVLAAIVVGARHQVSDAQWLRYSRTGTSHLMAISGLHIGLAAIGCYYLLRLMLGIAGIECNQKRVALLLAWFFALAYAAISGFAVPAQRALLMLALGTASWVMRRDACVLRILATSAVIIVLADPLSTLRPGFRLSFTAVALLFWYAAAQQRQVAGFWMKPVVAVLALARIQIVLALGLIPLSVLIFDRISVSAPLVNLLAVPLFSVVTVPLALCGLVFDGPFNAVGLCFLRAAATSIDVLDVLIVYVSDWSQSAQTVPAISSVAWLYLLLPLAWVLLPSRWPARSVAWLGVAALLIWRPAGPPPGCTDISILDVGQGLAVVVRVDDYVLLYDTGPAYRNGSSSAQHLVLPYLASVGIERIDRIVVSHSDLDHAGGVADVLAALPVADLAGGDALPTHTARRCSRAMAWVWGRTRFSVLHPEENSAQTGNDASCVVLIETGERRTLLTGDIESAVEAMLVRQRLLPAVDVVTVPHHGSRTSSIAPFVQSLTPVYAVVSAAYGNQWGFPKPDVVARWQASGAIVLNTATSGAIRFRQCAGSDLPELDEYRKRSRRIWHDRPQYAEF